MQEIIPFDFHSSEVRVVSIDGEPWFVASDALEILGVDRTSLRGLDEDEKGVDSIHTLGGVQGVTVISESGLYSLILRSRKPEARKFKRWITHEVIPSIRKHGMYATPQAAEAMLNDPDMMIRVLEEIKAERAKRAELEAARELDAPKVLFADSVAASHTSILVGDLAKILKGNGLDIGANRLFEKLRTDGYLIRRQGTDWNMPTQRSMELGLFEIKETAISHSDGHVSINKTPKVTGKGQQYFIERFLAKAVA